MKKIYKLSLTFLFVFAGCVSVVAQNNFFSNANESKLASSNLKQAINPVKFRTLSVNNEQLKNFLWSLPAEKTILYNRNQAPIMELPMPDGHSAKFRVWESSIQEPGLEAKFPEIKTFSGQGIDDPYATIRFDYSPYFGFRAQILSAVTGRIYIDPYAKGSTEFCISYYHIDNRRNTPFNCMFDETEGLNRVNGSTSTLAGPCRGTEIRTYRLAVSCTGEYAVAVGGGVAGPTHAAIVTSVNRITGVYEVELAIKMVLVANNNLIEYLNGATDPFINTISGNLLNSNQTNTDLVIGSANYDIGHIFTSDDNGLAQLSAVCGSGKARGATGSPSLIGDGFDIDYVAHEMGHQFGAPHTFNSAQCASAGGSYEPGGGTTIMAYAGICGASDNIQPNSDAVFHPNSFDAISNFLQAGGANCGVVTPNGNTLPVITSMSSNNVSIPINTPFTLTGAATDANGDAITYNWDGWDIGPAGTWLSAASSTTRPLFRTRLSKTTGSRTFPDPRVIAANYPGNAAPSAMDGLRGEVLPTVARTMKFRLTVRDNRAGGGGVVSGGDGCSIATIFQVNAVGTAPFTITAPNGGETWTGASTQTVTWNVSGTNAAPINVADVKITLSTDGGLTFPIVVSAGTANDGTESVTVPAVATTTARMRVEAVGNIFFDISNTNFTITIPPSGFTFGTTTPATITCGGATSAAILLTSAAQGGFSTPINLTATGNPAGTTVTFASNPLTPGNSTDVLLTNTNTLAPGTYNVTVTGVAGAITQNTTLTFTVNPGAPPTINTQPVPVTLCEGGNASFTVAASGTVTYQWQVNSGAGFTNITGATSATYAINNVPASLNNNQYQVVVSALCGTTTSTAVLLTVNSAAAITTQPASAAVCTGNSNTFTVVATPSTGLTYQWQENTGSGFNNIPGANSASYTLNGITIAQNNYQYQVIVSGACGAPVTSSVATLTVSSSVSISTQPVNVTACEGSNAVFTVAGSGSGILYQWQVNTGSGFSNIPGETNATLTITGVTAAQNGYSYQATLSNASCATASTSNAATLTVQTLPTITTQPTSVTLCAGSNHTFTAAATGTGTGYQWQVNTGAGFSDIPGATSATYTLNAIGAGLNNNQYQVVVAGACAPTAVSNAAVLTVVSPAVITTQPTLTPKCEGSTATLTVAGTNASIYQWQVNTGTGFTNIAGATSASYITPAITAAMNNNSYQVLVSNATCAAIATSNPVTLTVNALPTVTATSSEPSVCTGTAVTLTATGATSYTWAPGTIPALAVVTVNPEVNPSNPDVANPVTYTVTGIDGNGCQNTANVTVIASPLPVVTLTATPAITKILPGQSVTLTATVNPGTGFGFTWTKDGILIPGFTGSSRVVTVDEVGTYQVTAADLTTGACQSVSDAITISDSVSNRIFVWPVPNNGNFNVSYYNPGGVPNVQQLVIYDAKGARVYNKAFPIGRTYTTLKVNLSGVGTGMYVIELTDKSGNRLATEKILIH